MQRWLGGAAASGAPLPALGMSNSYHGEPYIPADVFNELQSEVSSLLEFKNALLSEFPHLHQKISALGVPHPPQQEERRRSTIGLAKAGREETDRDLSDDIPSSWNVSNPNTGSMPRLRKLRKSPEGSSTGSQVADSGFSTEKDGNSGTSTLLSPAGGGKPPGGPYPAPSSASPPEVRWDTWMMAGPHPAGPGSPPPSEDGDELMSLLDSIHRKAVKLRARELVEQELEEARLRPGREEGARRVSSEKAPPGLHPISENEGERPGREDARDRVRRKLGPELEEPAGRDRELLVDRISELESETLQSNRKVSRLEAEIARVTQQKEVLEDQLRSAVSVRSDLDAKIQDLHSQYVAGGPASKEGGIIHSVQILTGGPGERQGQERRLLTQSESSLTRRLAEGSGSINIEIRQPGGGPEQSRSSEHLLYRAEPLRPGRRGSPMGHSRSVVNLQQGSEEPLRHNSKFFQRISAPPGPGAKVSPQLHRVLSNEKLSPKSRSVENLSERARRDLAETSLQPHRHHGDSPASRLKGAQSEQLLSRLGRDGRARLDPALSSSVLSMPAELARGLRVRPNRERIRQVLGTTSVLELQRQLLTTVMENEVYKTQLGRMTDGWNGRIDEFERVNLTLQSSLARLREDNELIRLQVEEKSIELEGTRARVRQLEMRPDGARKGSTSSTASTPTASSSKLVQTDVPTELAARLGTDNYVKFGPLDNPKVTFDLGPKAKAQAKLLETAAVKRPVTVDLKTRQPSQLPSNAKQQLQEMAGIKRNYRKNSDAAPQTRPNRLNLATNGSPGQPPPPPARHPPAPPPPASPPKAQSPTLPSPPSPPSARPARASLTRRDSRTSQHNMTASAKNSMMNLQNNNIVNQRPAKREPVPQRLSQSGHPRTRTPSIERSISSLKEGLGEAREQGKGRLLPAPPASAISLEQHGLTSLELRTMGRDTIAGLIAGILQKYTKKEDGPAREGDTAGRREAAGNALNTSFVEIALAEEEPEGRGVEDSEAGSRPVTVLRRTSQSSLAGEPRPRRTPTGKSWETYNHTEEELHRSHTAYSTGGRRALGQHSLTLPDSLNEFEGEEYQSPQLYLDSLGQGGARQPRPQDADSLQFAVSPTPAPASKSPLDSLIAIKGDPRSKMTAAEFFDSITSIEKEKPDDGVKRRIIPYCDNSLSSGTSAFTSQDVSFDSKDSSPSDQDRSRQAPVPASHPGHLYPPPVTLSIHPLGPSPALLPRRFPAPGPLTGPLRIEDYMATVDEPQPHTELDRHPQGNANEVRRGSERDSSQPLANQTKEIQVQAQPASRSRDSNMSIAKAATEKLKWKFLGW